MVMTVGNQVYVFFSCVLGGMLVAFIYDVFRVGRKAIKSGNLIICLEDFTYWIIAAFVLFGIVYYSNDGEIRGYVFIGVIQGIVIYALLLSRIVMKVFLFIIGVIYKIIITLFSFLLIPFKIVYKIIRVPARIISGIFAKGGRKIKRIGKVRLEKLKILKIILKNIRKKI
ncbi:MAG: spore cortex biosynthesis protein YabQ [Clostridiaceae bacterium]|nr:spore cortex biosynthesis protein YabQ [Clostridiaceae bacterium]